MDSACWRTNCSEPNMGKPPRLESSDLVLERSKDVAEASVLGVPSGLRKMRLERRGAVEGSTVDGTGIRAILCSPNDTFSPLSPVRVDKISGNIPILTCLGGPSYLFSILFILNLI